MKKVSLNLSNFNLPAPAAYRKFENAYTIILAPAIIVCIQSWGLSEIVVNRAMILLGFSVALVKFMGMLLANGQAYTESEASNNPLRMDNPPPPPSKPQFPDDQIQTGE